MDISELLLLMLYSQLELKPCCYHTLIPQQMIAIPHRLLLHWIHCPTFTTNTTHLLHQREAIPLVLKQMYLMLSLITVILVVLTVIYITGWEHHNWVLMPLLVLETQWWLMVTPWVELLWLLALFQLLLPLFSSHPLSSREQDSKLWLLMSKLVLQLQLVP